MGKKGDKKAATWKRSKVNASVEAAADAAADEVMQYVPGRSDWRIDLAHDVKRAVIATFEKAMIRQGGTMRDETNAPEPEPKPEEPQPGTEGDDDADDDEPVKAPPES